MYNYSMPFYILPAQELNFLGLVHIVKWGCPSAWKAAFYSHLFLFSKIHNYIDTHVIVYSKVNLERNILTIMYYPLCNWYFIQRHDKLTEALHIWYMSGVKIVGAREPEAPWKKSGLPLFA